MSSADVIRVPVAHVPEFRAKVIPDLIRLHEKTVGPVPHGKGGEPSAAHVIRWGCTEAVRTRLQSAITNTQGLKEERARTAELDAKLAAAVRELQMANGRVVATETAALVLRAELDDAHEALRMERAAVDSLFTKSIALAAAPAQVANVDGARLKSARELRCLTQQELAELLGYSERSAVSLAERGRAPLSPSMMKWLEGQPGGSRQE